jgi:hypothetical protein
MRDLCSRCCIDVLMEERSKEDAKFFANVVDGCSGRRNGQKETKAEQIDSERLRSRSE